MKMTVRHSWRFVVMKIPLIGAEIDTVSNTYSSEYRQFQIHTVRLCNEMMLKACPGWHVINYLLE